MADFRPFGEGSDKIQRTVHPLVRRIGNDYQPVGTGFVINPAGYLMTAAHVIMELGLQTGPVQPGNITLDPEIFAGALYISTDIDPTTGQEIGGLLPILKMWCPPELDVGFIQVSMPRLQNGDFAIKLPVVRLSAKVPKIGETVIAAGYHTMSAKAQENILEIRQESAVAKGVVTEVYPQFRDRTMLNFPCIQTDSRFEGGMSGGPVFNSEGNVCAIVCSSFGSHADGGFTSFASLMWPAFGAALEAKFEGEEERFVSLHEMALRNLVQVDESLSNVQVLGNPGDIRQTLLRV